MAFRLLWSSGDIHRETIPSKFFFTTNRPSPIKISRYLNAAGTCSHLSRKHFRPYSLDPKLYAVSLLFEGAAAYSDNQTFQLRAIPGHLKGLRYIRSPQVPSTSLFEFRVNQPARLYIGYPTNKPFPVAPFEDYLWKVQETEDSLSVHEGGDGSHDAKEALQFAVKRVFHRGGPISFSVVHMAVPFIIILAAVKEPAAACGEESI